MTNEQKAQENRGWLDLPRGNSINTIYEQLWGWVDPVNPVREVRFVALGKVIKHSIVDRPDLRSVEFAFGFTIFLDIPTLAQDVHLPSELIVECFDNDVLLCQFSLAVNITSEMIENQRKNNIFKRAFIVENAKFPLSVPSNCKALSALPSDWEISPSIADKKDQVSSHFYGRHIQEFLAQLPAGAMVLDAGAGFRKTPYENVINLEIYDYPSTDILATGDQLPFKDNVFDAVLSLAVLEHVRDPFRCAQELERVLKPGGKVFTMIPFLQAEHGYPSHYFNSTRFGVRELFKNMQLVSQFLDPSNLPIFTVHQILRLYATSLNAQTQKDFLSMSVNDILQRAPHDWLEHPIVTELSVEDSYIIAWGTTTIFSKK